MIFVEMLQFWRHVFNSKAMTLIFSLSIKVNVSKF